MISQRTREALAAKKARGEQIGPAPSIDPRAEALIAEWMAPASGVSRCLPLAGVGHPDGQGRRVESGDGAARHAARQPSGRCQGKTRGGGMRPQVTWREEGELGVWTRYSRKINWPQRGRAMTGATALIAFWAYCWSTSSHGSPEYAVCFWMTIFSVFAAYIAIAETRRMDDDVDLCPRRSAHGRRGGTGRAGLTRTRDPGAKLHPDSSRIHAKGPGFPAGAFRRSGAGCGRPHPSFTRLAPCWPGVT